jgi:tetratricopeptide (TPR) repeat protein
MNRSSAHQKPKSIAVWLLVLTLSVFNTACNKTKTQSDNADEQPLSNISGSEKRHDTSNDYAAKQASFETTKSGGVHDDQPSATKPHANSGLVESSAAVELAGKLANLTAKAKRLETEGNFEEAVVTWDQIRNELLKSYPANSWQVANAEVAMEFARRVAGFTDQQRNDFQQLTTLKTQLESQLKASQYNEAMGTCMECERLVAGLFGIDSIWFAKTQIECGQVLFRQSQWQHAIEKSSKAIDLFSSQYPGNHPDVELCLELIAQCYRAMNQLDEALNSQKQLTRLTEDIWGVDSLQYATRLNDLGTLQHAMQQLDQASQNLQKADAIRETLLGPENVERGVTLRNRAVVAMDMKQLDLAYEMFSEARQIFSSQFGPSHRWTIDATKKIAVVHLLKQENQRAELELKIVQQTIQQLLGDQHLEFAQASFELSVALGNQGKFDVAKPLLDKAYQIQASQLGIQHPTARKTREVLDAVNQRLTTRQ